jgi:hypothetical protein
MRGLGASYQPGYFGNQFRAPQQYRTGQFDMMSAEAPDLQQYQMGPAERVQGGDYNAPMMGTAQANYRPDIQSFQMGPAQQVQGGQYSAPEMAAAQTGYRPELQNYQMGPAQQVGTQDYTGGNVAKYMDPYMQQVVGIRQREAQRMSDIAGTQEAGQAVKQGAFGGARAGLLEAERQRNLATQLGDIQATGSQAAFQNAQQQFNQQQQRDLQAQQANQQAGLTTGQQNLAANLGVQQLGTQTGLQAALANLNNQQQAAVQNQAAQLQTQGLSANQAMQAALANQQAGLTVGQQNLAAQQQAQQLGVQTGLQTSLANLTAEQQANVQNQAAQLQTQGLSAGQAMQAALANQQAGLTTGQQNLAAQLSTQQLGAGQNMQAQLANQQAYQDMLRQREASRQFGYGQDMTAAAQRAQYGQAANQLAEQSRQYGAGYGMQGLQTALSGAGQLGNLGQQEFGQQKDIYNLQNQFGAQQQALRQQGLSQAYQDFLDERNNPYKQLGYMSDLIRGLPLGQQSTSQVYQAPGSMMGQLGGIGMGAYGLSRMMGAEGGEVKEYADGGSVTSDNSIDSILGDLSDAQLQQARANAVQNNDQHRLEMIDAELAERASLRSGVGSAFNSLPEETQNAVTEMAGGGIVAFADGDLVGDPGGTGASAIAEAATGVDNRSFLERLTNEPQWKADLRREREGKAAAAPAAKAAPSQAPQAAPAPSLSAKKEVRTASAPVITRQTATEAVKTIADAAKIEIPKDETRQLAKGLFDELMAKSSSEKSEFKAELDAAKNRAKEIEARGIGEAMMKFGFAMAASAAKPGVARRSGLGGALEAAASASPVFAESMAENAKLQQAAQDNYMKLRMENAKYQSALEQGNMQLAASMANNISQRQLTQAQLEQQIKQSDRMFGLEKEKLGVMRSQAGQPTSIQKIASDLQAADPSLDRRAALNEASRISGYSFKGEAAAGGKLQAALNKIEDDYKMLPALMAASPDSKMTQSMVADRKRRREEAYRLYGSEQPTGVGSKQNSQWSIEPVAGG